MWFEIYIHLRWKELTIPRYFQGFVLTSGISNIDAVMVLNKLEQPACQLTAQALEVNPIIAGSVGTQN